MPYGFFSIHKAVKDACIPSSFHSNSRQYWGGQSLFFMKARYNWNTVSFSSVLSRSKTCLLKTCITFWSNNQEKFSFKWRIAWDGGLHLNFKRACQDLRVYTWKLSPIFQSGIIVGQNKTYLLLWLFSIHFKLDLHAYVWHYNSCWYFGGFDNTILIDHVDFVFVTM